MGLTIRPSHPALLVVRQAIRHDREQLLRQWVDWVDRRIEDTPGLRAPTVERQFAILIDILIELAGPLRKQATELWFSACEEYGRTAAVRGLAAGEVVEEIQYLRELLIHLLSETVFDLPPRQSMAVVLRINRMLDRGIAHAVVGYTDALVETLLDRSGVPVAASEPVEMVVAARVEHLEEEVRRLQNQAA